MTELISAHIFAMNILERTKRMISAIKIQRTWRRINVTEERTIAMRNKRKNTIVIPEGFKGSRACVNVKRRSVHTTTIIPNWNKMKVNKRKTHRISFNDASLTRSDSGSSGSESVDLQDGINKDTFIFNAVTISWIKTNTKDKDIHFFSREGKVWLENPEKWKSFLCRTIENLNENKIIVLWTKPGKIFKLYPLMHKRIIMDLQKTLLLHLVRSEIEILKKEHEKYI